MINYIFIVLEKVIQEELLKCKSVLAKKEISVLLEDLRDNIARIIGYIELDKGLRK